jgi:hypothetical protein
LITSALAFSYGSTSCATECTETNSKGIMNNVPNTVLSLNLLMV